MAPVHPQVCSRMMPGFGEQMRAISLRCGPLPGADGAAAPDCIVVHCSCQPEAAGAGAGRLSLAGPLTALQLSCLPNETLTG